MKVCYINWNLPNLNFEIIYHKDRSNDVSADVIIQRLFGNFVLRRVGDLGKFVPKRQTKLKGKKV